MISIVFAGWGTTESVTKKSTWKILHIICSWRRSAVDFLLLNCINLRQVLVLIFFLVYVCCCVISNWSILWKKTERKIPELLFLWHNPMKSIWKRFLISLKISTNSGTRRPRTLSIKLPVWSDLCHFWIWTLHFMISGALCTGYYIQTLSAA